MVRVVVNGAVDDTLISNTIPDDILDRMSLM